MKSVHGPKCPDCEYLFDEQASKTHVQQNPACRYRRKKHFEYITEAKWEEIEGIPRRGRDTRPGEHWKIIYRKLFGADNRIPAPYLPSLEHCRQAAAQPPERLLSYLQQIQLSNHPDGVIPFFPDETSLRLCLRVVVPTLIDFVSQNGVLLENQEQALAVEEFLLLPEESPDEYVNFDDFIAE